MTKTERPLFPAECGGTPGTRPGHSNGIGALKLGPEGVAPVGQAMARGTMEVYLGIWKSAITSIGRSEVSPVRRGSRHTPARRRMAFGAVGYRRTPGSLFYRGSSRLRTFSIWLGIASPS